MTKVCTHGRDGKVAMRQLEDSLRRLRTDYLDLWQIHEVAFDDEPRRHFAKGGAVEALDKAREQGKVRYRRLHRAQGSRRCTSRCCRTTYKWDACSCRSTASTAASAASSSACCPS